MHRSGGTAEMTAPRTSAEGAAPQRIAQQRHDQSPFSGWIERRSHLVTEELEQQRDPGFAGCR